MNVLKSLLSQMDNLTILAKQAINNQDWNQLEIVQNKLNSTSTEYQKVCDTKNIVEVTSLRITQKTIELVSEVIGKMLNKEEVKNLITNNTVTLALPFTGGYLTK